MQSEKDAHLWELAKRRVGFKRHLATYIGMNAFFWILWFFTGWVYSYYGTPWPVWPMIGWGVGLLFHYLGAYIYNGNSSVETEYDKLKRQQDSAK